jgi:hypothetical protein
MEWDVQAATFDDEPDHGCSIRTSESVGRPDPSADATITGLDPRLPAIGELEVDHLGGPGEG